MFEGVHKEVVELMRETDEDFARKFDSLVEKMPQEVKERLNSNTEFSVTHGPVTYTCAIFKGRSVNLIIEDGRDGSKIMVATDAVNPSAIYHDEKTRLGALFVEKEDKEVSYYFDVGHSRGEKACVEMEKFVREIIPGTKRCVENTKSFKEYPCEELEKRLISAQELTNKNKR